MSNEEADPSDAAAPGGGNGGNDLTEPLLPPPPEPPLEAGAEEEDVPAGNGIDERFSDEEKEGDEDDAAVTVPLLIAVSVSSISQFLLGYNTGVMNAPHAVVFPSHTTSVWSAAVAVFALGGAAGAALGGRTADGCGRRGAALVAAGVFVLGGTLQSLAPNMGWIVLARFVVGIASGMASTIGPVYLREVGPKSFAGAMGTLTQLSITSGILVADLLAFPWATPDPGWRRLFGFTAALAGVQLVLSPFMAESPRWSLTRDSASKEAREALRKLRGLRSEEEAERAAREVLREAREDAGGNGGGDDDDAVGGLDATRPTDNTNGNGGGGGKTATVGELFRDRSVRLPLITALVLPAAQQLCGINAVFYYSTMFFDGIVTNPLLGTTFVGLVNVLFTVVALGVMDRFGRRTLIMCSSSGMFLCCVVIVLALNEVFSKTVALTAVNLYVATFNLGLGPIPFMVVPELFNHKYVASAVSASLFVNWTCNFLIGLTFPYMHEGLGPYSFVPFGIVLAGTFAFAWGWMPETSGKGGCEGEERPRQEGEECDGSII